MPGYSGIDGLPVPVVVVRRNSPAGLLEVIRGYHPSPEWPATSAPPTVQRHQIPAASFIPHPRRELIIDDQRFFYSTVASSVRCVLCGAGDIGFGFVGSEVPLVGMEPTNADHRVLCERCAERLASTPAR